MAESTVWPLAAREAAEALLADLPKGPWFYRSKEFDDWGFIRDREGNLIAAVRTPVGSVAALDEHRSNKTDPYEKISLILIAAPLAIAEVKRLESEVERVTGYWVRDENRAVEAEAKVERLEAENKVLREALEKAPCAPDCASLIIVAPGSRPRPCDCWKAAHQSGEGGKG